MLRNTRTFNRAGRLVEGWYWALPAQALKRGTVKPVNLMGRELAIYRGQDGVAVAMDAYCPHMGAHLAQGRVEAMRCGACSMTGNIRRMGRAWRCRAWNGRRT